jgi:hypothetical protein
MLLLGTTLFHLIPLWIPSQCLPSDIDPYPIVIVSATVFSCIWHYTEEKDPVLTALDMFFALLWFSLDLFHAIHYHSTAVLIQVIYLNLVVGLIHILYESMKQNRTQYIINHSLWHLLSASKCVAIATLLQCKPPT